MKIPLLDHLCCLLLEVEMFHEGGQARAEMLPAFEFALALLHAADGGGPKEVQDRF